MNSFWKYYSGEAIAPYPTIFIGGNHEASNYLWELYYGGWAAPNIYFLGFAGVVKFGNLRIGGLSGLYGPKHYRLGHYERPPYNEGTIKSLYHVREYNVHKLMQVEEPIDIFLSHDWPVGITLKELFKFKKDFEQDIKDRRLGSEAAAQFLQKLKPPYCFSAHLHCKFAARVRQGEDGPVTNFLALNKCCRESKGEFLQVIDVESGPGPYEIQYDEEWLGITRQFNSVFPLTVASANFSNVYLDKEACQNWVRSKLQARGSRPFEFCRTVPSHDPDSTNKFDSSRGAFPGCNRNPQTESLLQFLELPYLLDNMSESLDAARSSVPSIKEIFIDDVDESDPEE